MLQTIISAPWQEARAADINCTLFGSALANIAPSHANVLYNSGSTHILTSPSLSVAHDGASLVRLGDRLDLLLGQFDVSRGSQLLDRLDLGRPDNGSRHSLVGQDPGDGNLSIQTTVSSLLHRAPTHRTYLRHAVTASLGNLLDGFVDSFVLGSDVSKLTLLDAIRRRAMRCLGPRASKRSFCERGPRDRPNAVLL